MVTDEQSKDAGDGETAIGQPAASKKKKKKREDKDTSVLVECEANAKKEKGKKAKGTSKLQASEPVSLLGLDSADAPWANESVPNEIAAQGVHQNSAQTVMQAKRIPVGSQGKSQQERGESVHGALSKDQALPLLGHSVAKKPLSQSKKRKSRRAS